MSTEKEHPYSLTINADDFGYCPERNRGILECFTQGCVTRASLLVNGSAALEGVRQAKTRGLPLGLHLNLTEGTPIAKDVPSLMHEDHPTVMRGKEGFVTALEAGKITEADIRKEMIAQIERFREMTGEYPYHLDGHNHAHVFPMVRDVLVDVLSSSYPDIFCVRVPHNDGDAKKCSPFIKKVNKHAKECEKLFQAAGIRSAFAFVGFSLMGANLTLANFQKAIKAVLGHHHVVQCELMVHPGFRAIEGQGGCGAGPDDFALSEERERELVFLMNPDLRTLLDKLGIDLVA